MNTKGEFSNAITDILEKNCRLYGDDVALVESIRRALETKRTTWKEFDLIEPSVQLITEEKSHGMYLTKRQIDLPICWLKEESKKEKKWGFS